MKNEETFVEKLYECNQHKQKLLVALNKLEKFMPLSTQKYIHLSVEDDSFVDQLIFRFSKLQDSMGEKLFPALLELIGEDIKSKPFIDRLNRLEELELLNKREWLGLRKDRNEIAHEYSFNNSEVVASINIIYESVKKLLAIYNVFYQYCFNRFDFVKEATVLVNKGIANN